MDKSELATRRARNAIIALLVAMEQPKSDDERRASTLEWENMSWVQLLKSMHYNLDSEHNPYSNSVLMRAMKDHAQWCVREAEHTKSAARQREMVNA